MATPAVPWFGMKPPSERPVADGRGRQCLEALTHSYLGDWITRQQDGLARKEPGAEGRLTAALELKARLTAIAEGEPPHDLFIRWKPLHEQPLGWQPDLNDGVRLNIRPFMADDLPGGKKAAGILRTKPNIHWRKDRGKEPLKEERLFPWFWIDGKFTGVRINDQHFSLALKQAVQKQSVPSSNLSSVGYDNKTETLEVEFLSGSVYQYYNVPQNIHDELMKAVSKGRFLNTHIKNAYPYSRVG